MSSNQSGSSSCNSGGRTNEEREAGGTRGNRQATEVLYVVLLFVLSALAGGCRGGETGPAQVQPLPFTLSFAAGMQFVYNTWTLDQNYPQVVRAKTTSIWRVLRTGADYQGMSGVTVIADSAVTGSGGRDTLYLSTSAAGDLSIYGFLARIARQRFGRYLFPRWDLVASFSAGTTGTWTVGSIDSLGEETVFGNVVGASEYYSATVDGVTEVFPTYQVDLTGSSLYYSLWFSNTPNAIVRLLEEPDPEGEGQLRELVAIRTGAH